MAKDRGSGGSAGSRSVGSDFRGNRLRRDFDAPETAGAKPDEEDGDWAVILDDGREAVEMGEGEWYEADPKTGAILWDRPLTSSELTHRAVIGPALAWEKRRMRMYAAKRNR